MGWKGTPNAEFCVGDPKPVLRKSSPIGVLEVLGFGEVLERIQAKDFGEFVVVLQTTGCSEV